MSSWPKSSEGTYVTPEMYDPLMAGVTLHPEYPHRYYAGLFEPGDPAWEGIPGQVKTWLDAWRFDSLDGFPPADKMIPMTIEQWEFHQTPDDQGFMRNLSAKWLDGEFYPSHPF